MSSAGVQWLRYHIVLSLPVPDLSPPFENGDTPSAFPAARNPSELCSLSDKQLVCLIAMAAERMEELRLRLAKMIQHHVSLTHSTLTPTAKWMCWALLTGCRRRPTQGPADLAVIVVGVVGERDIHCGDSIRVFVSKKNTCLCVCDVLRHPTRRI